MKILSPAGSYDAVLSAVKFGADAVYLGLSDFSARKNAKNFTSDELEKAVKHCKKRGVEVFAAVNTLIYENEIMSAARAVKTAANAGVTGIIVQDWAVYDIIKRIAPDIKIVASTQMTVNNVYGVRLLEKYGFDTVVLPRELTKAQIKEISDRTDINIEIFCHGALCVCYSGQCYFSSFIGARSGNRGLCAQPCRMMYEYKSKKGYFLSPKDLSLVHNLREVGESGADVIKIEGRLKSEYYTAAVTDVYRRTLDSGHAPSEEDAAILNASFMRGGYTAGYFKGIKNGALFNYKKRENPYSDDTKKLEKHYSDLLRQSGDYYKTPANLSVTFQKDYSISVEYEYLGQIRSFVSSVKAEKANNAPLNAEKVSAQLSKTGSEPFYFENINVNFEVSDPFLSVSGLNNIRREISADMDEMLNVKPNIGNFSYNLTRRKAAENIEVFATVRTAQQLKWIREKQPDTLIFARRTALEEYETKYGKLTNVGLRCERIPDEKSLNDDKTFLLSHPEITKVMAGTLGAAAKFKDKYEIYGDFTLNITNSIASEFYSNEGVKSQTVSVELNLKNIKDMGNTTAKLNALAYGSVPLMVTESCIKSAVKNGCTNEPITITDRKNEEFVIACESCSKNEIYNSYPIIMTDKLDDIKNAGISTIRLDFVFENKAQTEEILMCVSAHINPLTKFTRGHFYRGAL